MAVKTVATKTFQGRTERRRGITYVIQHKLNLSEYKENYKDIA